MKSLNKSLVAIGLIATTGLFFTSCKKTVTPKKVDGTWNVTSGSASYKSENSNSETNTTTNYNGTVLTTTGETKFDGGSIDIDTELNVTYKYTFDKKTGEYTMTSVSSGTDEDGYSNAYYEFDSNTDMYVYAGQYERTSDRTSTTTEEGFFTVTGDAGDEIEKNSQIVFQPKSGSYEYSETYTYKDADNNETLDANTTFVQEWNPSSGEYVFTKVDTKDSGKSSSTGSDSEGQIWTVTELKKGEMMVEWTDEDVFVDANDGDNNNSSKETTNWTLTQE